MKKTLDEQDLNLSGMVNSIQAVQIGQLTGAKVLVTGSVIEADKTLYLVAKVIGTETRRVLGASVKGRTNEEIAPLAEQLAQKVANTITEDAEKLVAKEVEMEDRIAALNKKLGDAERPTLLIQISERHVGQITMDPAAQTESAMICKKSGFDVIDLERGSFKQADMIIKGEGFSEFATRRGNIVSVKARLEGKAANQNTDEIIATDCQTAVAVDLTEQIAGKAVLQDAATAIAERMLPKVVEE
jgi:hypothetical protein